MDDEDFAPSFSLPPGTILDNRFEVLHVLGQGASGVVYKAKILTLQQLVAVKVLHQDLVLDAKNLERLTREVHILSQLDDPGVVRVKSANLTGDSAYFVMELLDGSSLKDYLAEKGCLSAQQFTLIFGVIASALAAAHQRLILHRDIKPGNIIVGGSLETGVLTYAKLIDFGLSNSIANNMQDGKLTGTGAIAGTPAYMSPEQCSGTGLDERSDIYSLGCVMYESVTTRKPFDGDTPYAVMQKQLVEPIAFRPEDQVADSVKDLIIRCMEKEPEKRFQSMHEVTAFLAGLDTAKLRISVPTKTVSTGRCLAIAMLVVVAVAGSTNLLRPSRPPTVKELVDTGSNTSTNLARITEARRVGLEPFRYLLARANFYGDQENDDAAATAKKLFEELEGRPDLLKVEIGDRINFYLSYANFLRGQRDKAKSLLDKADSAISSIPGYSAKRSTYFGILEQWYKDGRMYRETVDCSRENLECLRVAGLRDQLAPAVIDLSDQQMRVDKTGAASFKTINDALSMCDPEYSGRLNGHKAVLSVLSNRPAEFKRALSDVLSSKDSWSGMELRAIAEALYWKHRYSDGLEMAVLALQRLEPNYSDHPYDYMLAGALTSMLYRKLNQNAKALAVCDKLKIELNKLPGVDPSILARVAKERAKIGTPTASDREFGNWE